MKYKKDLIIEDRFILDKGNDYEVAEKVGCSPMYINLLRRDKKVATEEFYLRLVKALDKE
jgi:hypothetical protein